MQEHTPEDHEAFPDPLQLDLNTEVEVLRSTARAFRKAGDLDRAEVHLLRALELQTTASLYLELAWIYTEGDRVRDLARVLRQALYTRQERGVVYAEVGALLLGRGRVRQAVRWLNRSLRTREEEGRHLALYNLAVAFERLQRPERSKRYLNLALRGRPDFVAARNFLADLRRVS